MTDLGTAQSCLYSTTKVFSDVSKTCVAWEVQIRAVSCKLQALSTGMDRFWTTDTLAPHVSRLGLSSRLDVPEAALPGYKLPVVAIEVGVSGLRWAD